MDNFNIVTDNCKIAMDSFFRSIENLNDHSSSADGSGAMLPVQKEKGEIYLPSSSPNSFEGYVVMKA
jgi:hypothetical protein